MALGTEPALNPVFDDEIFLEHALCEVRCVANEKNTSGCVDCCSTSSSRSHASRCSTIGTRPTSRLLGQVGARSGSGVVAYVAPGHPDVSEATEAWGQPSAGHQRLPTPSSCWDDDGFFESLDASCGGLTDRSLACIPFTMATSDFLSGPTSQGAPVSPMTLDPEVLYRTVQELSVGTDICSPEFYTGTDFLRPVSLAEYLFPSQSQTGAAAKATAGGIAGSQSAGCLRGSTSRERSVETLAQVQGLSDPAVAVAATAGRPRQPLRSCSGGSNRSSSPALQQHCSGGGGGRGGGGDSTSQFCGSSFSDHDGGRGSNDGPGPSGGASSSTCASASLAGSSPGDSRDTADSGPREGGAGSAGAAAVPPSRHLWLGNLLQNVDSHAVEVLFTFFGVVQSVRVFPSKPSSFAFVNYSSVQSAMSAKAALEGQPVPSLTGIKPLLIRYQQPHQHLRLRGTHQGPAPTPSGPFLTPQDHLREASRLSHGTSPIPAAQGQGGYCGYSPQHGSNPGPQAQTPCQVHGRNRFSCGDLEPSEAGPQGYLLPGGDDEEEVDLSTVLSSLSALGLSLDGRPASATDFAGAAAAAAAAAAGGDAPTGRVLSGSLPSGAHGLGAAAGMGDASPPVGARGAICTCTPNSAAVAAAAGGGGGGVGGGDSDRSRNSAGHPVGPGGPGAGVAGFGRRGSSGGSRGDEAGTPPPLLSRSLLHSVPSRHMWLGNMVSTAEVRDIEMFFGPFGPLESVRLFPDRNFAFVNFTAIEHAAAARKALHGVVLPRLTGLLPMEIRFQHRGAGPRGLQGPNPAQPPSGPRGPSAGSCPPQTLQPPRYEAQNPEGWDAAAAGYATGTPDSSGSRAFLSRQELGMSLGVGVGMAPSSPMVAREGSGSSRREGVPLSLAEALMQCLAAGDSVPGVPVASGDVAQAPTSPAGAASDCGGDAAAPVGGSLGDGALAGGGGALPQMQHQQHQQQQQQAFMSYGGGAGGGAVRRGSSGSGSFPGRPGPPHAPQRVASASAGSAASASRPGARVGPTLAGPAQSVPRPQGMQAPAAAGTFQQHQQQQQLLEQLGGQFPPTHPHAGPAAALLQQSLGGGGVPQLMPQQPRMDPQMLARLRCGLPPGASAGMLPQAMAGMGAGAGVGAVQPQASLMGQQMAPALPPMTAAAAGGLSAAGLWNWALQGSAAEAEAAAAAAMLAASAGAAAADPAAAMGWPMCEQQQQPGLVELMASQQYLQALFQQQQQQRQQQQQTALMAALVSQQQQRQAAAAGPAFHEGGFMAAAAAAAAAAGQRPGGQGLGMPGGAASTGQRRSC